MPKPRPSQPNPSPSQQQCNNCQYNGVYNKFDFSGKSNTLALCDTCDKLFCAGCARKHRCPHKFPKGFKA